MKATTIATTVLSFLAVNGYDLHRKRDVANATYKDPSAPVESRVTDLLSRMTIEEKTSQLIQGDISNWINTTTNAFNYSGLVSSSQ